MSPTLKPLADIFALNTDLVANCLVGLDESQAHRRLQGGGNSVAFLVAHLTDSRHHLADLLGSQLQNPLAELLSGARSIDDVERLPALSDLLDAWHAVGYELSRLFQALTAADLEVATLQTYPISGGTVLDAIAFLAQHDSYHLGQIAFLRRQLGLGPMTYSRL